MSASCPPSTRSTSASTVASPHSSRWLPRTQRSPGRLTGSSGGSGTSSSASSLAASPSASASSRSSSVASKPTRSRSKRSSRSQASSSASSASSQPACRASWLSAIRVGPLLRLAQVLEPDHRHLGEPELAGREQPAVAGEDAGVLVDQDRVGPAELDHRAPRSGPPAPRCACAGCARTGAAGRSATARSARRAR